MTTEALPESTSQHTLRRVVLFILFFYIATPFEISGENSGAGYALLLKSMCAFLFMGILLCSRPYIANRNILIFALSMSGYVLFLNLSGLTMSAFMMCALIFFGIVVADFAIEESRNDITHVLTAYLVFNVIGLVLAVLWFWVSGDVFDFHQLVVPFSESRAGLQFNILRPSGFQIEPGTYSATMVLSVALRSVLVRKIVTPLHVVMVLSTLLTFSAWAFVACAVLSVAAVVDKLAAARISIASIKKAAATSLALVFLAVLVISCVPALYDAVSKTVTGYLAFVQLRFTAGSPGGGSLILFLLEYNAFMNSLPSAILLGKAISVSYAPDLASVDGLGLWAFLVFHFGLLPTVSLMGLVVAKLWRNFGLAFPILLVPVLISKEYMYEPSLWALITVALFAVTQKEAEETSCVTAE